MHELYDLSSVIFSSNGQQGKNEGQMEIQKFEHLENVFFIFWMKLKAVFIIFKMSNNTCNHTGTDQHMDSSG